VTVRISSRRPVRAKLVDEPLPGLSIEQTDLRAALGREDAGVRIAASRFGEELTVGRLETLAGRVQRDGMTVAFGAPRGLPAILEIEESAVGAAQDAAVDGDNGVEPTADPGFDLWLNTVPDQGSEVVRTEEALFATLAPLSLKRVIECHKQIHHAKAHSGSAHDSVRPARSHALTRGRTLTDSRRSRVSRATRPA